MPDKGFLVAYAGRITETVLLLLAVLVARTTAMVAITRIARQLSYRASRVVTVRKLISVIAFVIFLGGVFSIWGVERSELVFFASSMLTILGIAFFAQWSMLSNVTSTLIIFFSHPAGIGDRIRVLDNDFRIEGTIRDIGLLFTIVQTPEGDIVSIPNNVFTQKIVSRLRPAAPAGKGRHGSPPTG